MADQRYRYVLSPDRAQIAVLRCIRIIHGQEPVKAGRPTGLSYPNEATGGEKVRGHNADAGGSRRAPTLSEVSWARHPELTDQEYSDLLIVKKNLRWIVQQLGADGAHIWKEDQTSDEADFAKRYKMPVQVAARLERIYKKIARECSLYDKVPNDSDDEFVRRTFKFRRPIYDHFERIAKQRKTKVQDEIDRFFLERLEEISEIP